MSKHVFLSWILSNDMPCYDGSDKILIAPDKSIECGDNVNTLSIKMGNHVGTHIDFPKHFYNNGKTVVDYPPEWFIFENAMILNIPLDKGVNISEEMMKQQVVFDDRTELLILRTGYWKYYRQDKYWNDNPGLSLEAAKYIKSKFPNLRALGVDFISINAYNDKAEGRKAHAELLRHPEIVIIEGMDLSAIVDGIKKVIVAPLLIHGADGVPCTIIAEVVN